MPAYLIVRINVTDMTQYQDYMKLTPEIVKAHGGKFIARGGDTVTLEGDEETRRVVLVEFPSMEVAQAFYKSDAYQAAIDVRANVAEAQFVLIDGA